MPSTDTEAVRALPDRGLSAGGLPAERNGFVGRTAELARLLELLGTDRMITVTGPGGVGKTRLAVRAAARAAGDFEDGVCFLELSALRDPDLLPHTLAARLGLPEQDGRSRMGAVRRYLAGRRLLLVLDTCEHLVEACADLAWDLLREAPGLTVLATSRQPLNVAGEHHLPVPPLPVPEDAEGGGTRTAKTHPAKTGAARAGGAGDAVELFVQRARAARPGFRLTPANRADVVRLCRRLDGIPLAVELAAVRLRAVPLSELADRLEDRFRVLTGTRRGVLPRHQTLRTTIDWSHGLCDASERLVWARLSVFAGTFGLDDAREVCAFGELDGDEVVRGLVGLVEKSLVLRADDERGTRYRLLDMLREYGADRLEAMGGTETVRERHVRRHLALAQEFDAAFLTDGQVERYRAVRAAQADVRSALEHALARPELRRAAAALATALWGYWHIAGLHTEGRHWYAKVRSRYPAPVRERAWALAKSAYLGAFQADPAAADEARECAEIAGKLDDRRLTGRGLAYLNLSLTFRGRHEEAEEAARKALAMLEEAGDPVGLVTLETQIAYLRLLRGSVDSALEWCRRGLDRFPPDSEEAWVRGYLHYVWGAALFRRGAYERSAEVGALALDLKHSLGDAVGTAYCLELLGWLAAHERRHARTALLLGAADPLWKRAGARLGGTAIMERAHEDAARAARTALGAARYARYAAEAAARPLDDVVQEALTGAAFTPREPNRGLTERETEVALLVRDGLTNREIATRLTVSRRTVDSHVERILSKLAVASRTQVAEALPARPEGP
ncbi:LuxR C-terminal-related transcriptional regulator [Streptomyces albiaxialis]|uniref:LuxR C-terminal-related transcriptional regulator n=1 Tax=Streptomyces albiaxialis TaxID=329523 RepID=A0ABN2WL53_9ACTN